MQYLVSNEEARVEDALQIYYIDMSFGELEGVHPTLVWCFLYEASADCLFLQKQHVFLIIYF